MSTLARHDSCVDALAKAGGLPTLIMLSTSGSEEQHLTAAGGAAYLSWHLTERRAKRNGA